MLRIERLVKRYPGAAEVAVDGVDLTVERGETVALIGPSGAGKSTLIRCINRLVEPTSGRVFLDDLEITSLGSRALRRARCRIGMIFQEFALVERLTVMENLLTGRLGAVGFWRGFLRRFPAEDVDAAFELLARVGLEGRENDRADALSGGQRQRVGIARALLQRPDVLLVDEPTASLDPRTAEQVMTILARLAHERGLATVINIHDVPLARKFVGRVVGLHAGRVVYDGPPEGVDDDVWRAIYGSESDGGAGDDSSADDRDRSADLRDG